MKKNLLVAAMLAQPWALMPEYMTSMAGVVARWQAGIPASPEVMEMVAADRNAREARQAQASQARAGGGSIAVINVFGVITQRGNMMDDLSGGGSVSTEQLVQALRNAEADDTVGQVLMNFSSPGGSVYGVQECANEIARITKIKPIVGIANSMCASAAYWMAAQCSEFYITPGGEAGSIGVWQAHEDISKAMDEAGVSITLVSSGEFKVEGNPYQPLGDDAKAFMQLRTDQYYDAFVKAVAKGRGVGVDVVRNGMGQGRVLGAADAVAANMADGVMNIDEVIKKMQRTAKAGGSGARGALAEATTPEGAMLFVEATPAPHAVATPPSRLAAMLREIEIESL